MTATGYDLLHALSPNAGPVSIHEPLLLRMWGGRHYRNTEPVRSFAEKLRHGPGDDPAGPAGIVYELRARPKHRPAGRPARAREFGTHAAFIPPIA